MAKVFPFKGIRPSRDKANLVTTRSYLTYSDEILKEKLDNNPFTFLHILNPEYKKSIKKSGIQKFKLIKNKFLSFINLEILIKEKNDVFYIYQQKTDLRRVTGIIAATSIKEYQNDKIKKHEETILERENMFKEYLIETKFNADPVLLTHKKNEEIDNIINQYSRERSEYEFTTTDRISHKLWVVESKKNIQIIQNAFHKSNELYIADGHHRSASSSLLSNESDLKGKDFFMSFLVDEEQIEIFNFNRLIKNIDNQSTNEIIDLIGEKCSIKKIGNNQHIPTEKDEISMYIDKCWYSIKFDKIKNSNNLVKTLDPALLFDNILEPVFNIKDERKDKNLEFIDGKRPLNELQELVDSEQYSILFILKPISIHQIKKVADNKQSMPPKSTYIEPKLRSGLIIYEIE